MHLRFSPPRPTGSTDDAELLLTGGTGLIGGAVLADVLQTTRAHVTMLVRAHNADHARCRLEDTIETWLGSEGREAAAGRVRAIPADLERDDLGLEPRAREHLVARTTHVVHAAASVRFDNSLSSARAINVGGVSRILGLAEEAHHRGVLRRATVVSTAFVSGQVSRRFAEHELDVCQGFRNTYEQSKFEAEMAARDLRERIPLTIVRPSVVIGDSLSGYTTAFNVLYVPLRLFLRSSGTFTLPVRSMTPLDTVPVDWVAAVIREAVFRGADGQTYTAAAGRAHLTMDDLAALVAEVFDIPLARLLPVDASDDVVGYAVESWATTLSGRSQAALSMFAPYLLHGASFDSRWCDHLMQASGAVAPEPRAVLQRSLEYARATGFGRVRDAGSDNFRLGRSLDRSRREVA